MKENDETKIPKDNVSGGKITSECFAVFYGKKQEEVEKKIDNYVKRYPPELYNTATDIPPTKYPLRKELWYCVVRRSRDR